MIKLGLTAAVIKRSLCVLLSLSVLSYFSYHYLDANYTWLFLPVLLFATATQPDSIRDYFISLVSVVLGIATILIVILSLHGLPNWQIYSVTLISISCVYLSKRYRNFMLALLFLNLLAILSLSLSVSIYAVSWKIKALLEGVTISVLLQTIVLFRFYRDELTFWRNRALYCFIQFTQDAFACLIQPEYNDNLYLFERRLHNQKMKCLVALKKIRWFSQQVNSPELQAQGFQLASRLDHIYAVMLECAQLRRRITDYTVFQLCEIELTAISKDVIDILNAIQQKRNLNFSRFNQDIAKLENLYQQVVKVATREPLAFLLFIGGLKALSEELEGFAG